jgi:hypothetical protein
MRKNLFFILLLNFPLVCFAQGAVSTASPNTEEAQINDGDGLGAEERGGSFSRQADEEKCKNAGGKIMIIKECDGSESVWCEISEMNQCYADQVQDGECMVKMEDISPRVLCDKEQ